MQLQERYAPASLKANVNCLGVYSNNRPEWIVSDLAAHAYGMVTVALYDTLGAESVEYIINHTEMSIVVCSVDHIPVIIQLAAKTPSLKVIVSMDELAGPGEGVSSQTKLALLNAWAADTGVRLFSMSQVVQMGSESPRSVRPPRPDSLITINYTSGTTGMPKGALLTHGNVTAAVTTVFSICVQTADDIYISYLPLAHIFDRIGVATALCSGTGIGFFHGDFTKLLEDIQALKPTMMCAVPRVISRIGATIQSATINAPGVKGAISRRAFAAKLAKMKAGGDSRHMFWDAVWSRKIRAALGGRLRLLITGSALAPRDTMNFLRAALGIDICDGYGLTESSACATICLPGDCVPGHVGPPVPCNEIRLKDVPDMGYRSSDKPNPRGEIQLRGTAIFKGYFKDTAKTDEVLDEEGWFSTGDVGEVDSLGRFYIVDRVKSFLKLAQGEYVSPGRIESLLAAHELVAQVFVHGDSLQSWLVAIIGPNPDTFAPWASKILDRTIRPEDTTAINEACKDRKIRDAFLRVLDKISRQKKLQG